MQKNIFFHLKYLFYRPLCRPVDSPSGGPAPLPLPQVNPQEQNSSDNKFITHRYKKEHTTQTQTPNFSLRIHSLSFAVLVQSQFALYNH